MTGVERYWDSFRALGMRGERPVRHLKNHFVMTRSVNMDDGDLYYLDKRSGRVRAGATLTGSRAMSTPAKSLPSSRIWDSLSSISASGARATSHRRARTGHTEPGD